MEDDRPQRGKRKKKSIAETPVTVLVHHRGKKQQTRGAIFIHLDPDPSEDGRGFDGNEKRLGRGGDDFSPAAIFLKNECRTHGPRMKDNGGCENDAFYGFIIRMVDQKGDPRMRL